MENYIRYVELCRKNRLSDIIDNSSLAHAEVITKSLILLATECKLPIRIITGSLYEKFWNPIAPSLKEYFEKVEEPKIEIVIINEKNNKLNFVNNTVYNMMATGKDSGTTKLYHGAGARFISNQTHFILIGDEAYRKENSQNRAIAKASFNDPEEGQWLLETFNFVVNYINNPSVLAHQTT